MGFLREWEAGVKARQGFSKKEKNNMLLSQAMLTGLRMTGKCFDIIIMLYCYLVTLCSVLFCWISKIHILHT